MKIAFADRIYNEKGYHAEYKNDTLDHPTMKWVFSAVVFKSYMHGFSV